MPQALPAVSSLIKPDDILKISSFPDELRSKYVEGVSKLWGSIRNLPPEHEGHQAAHRKLVDITNQIRNHLRSKNLTQPGIGGAASASQATTTASMAQADRSAAQQQVLPNGQLQISQKVAQVAVGLQLLVPPPVAAQSQEVTQKWIKEAKQKYAQQLQRHETYQAQLSEIGQLVENRKKEGKLFTEQEKQELTTRKNAAEGVRNSAREYLLKFKQQQEALKAAMSASNLSAPQLDGTAISNNPMAMTENGEGTAVTQGALSQQPPEHQGQAHTVSSALDAARQHAGSTERTATSPTNTQYNQPLGNDTSGMQGQYIKKEPPGPQPPLNIATDANSHHESPQAGQPPGPSTQGPYPLSHQAAMAASAAHKYAQQSNHQATPQSTTHAHPTMSNRPDPSNNNNVKFPIPKELKVGPPQPVTMGPARPTLTGGPSNGAMGQLGQPAISRHPGYVLEGEGDRVLSKKRLQQLAREVTGASEGDDAEVMTPDVEEVSRNPRTQHHCFLNFGPSSSSQPWSMTELTTCTDTSSSRGRLHRSGRQQCLQARQVT